jgi:predicted ABC-type ATPase
VPPGSTVDFHEGDLPNGRPFALFQKQKLEPAGLRLVNADVITRELDMDPYAAAKVAAAIRKALVDQRESFVFETVFSDPVDDRLSFLEHAAQAGYTVLLCFIGISGAAASEERVAMRVSQGGHDVPTEKLKAGYPQILSNLKKAMRDVPLGMDL